MLLRVSAARAAHAAAAAAARTHPLGRRGEAARAASILPTQQRRWCSGDTSGGGKTARALTDAEIEAMRRGIQKSVGNTTARDWMPAFAFDFVVDCLLDTAVRRVHVERGLETDDPVYTGDIHVIPEAQWAPKKVCVDLPLRRTAARPRMDEFFEVVRSELQFTNERLWTMHLGTPERKFVEIARVGALPACDQPPVAWEGPESAALLIDPDDRGVPKIFIQLSPELPPILFLPVRPKTYAVHRVMRELKKRMVDHAREARFFWEEKMGAGERLIRAERAFHDDNGAPALDDPSQWERAMNLTSVMASLPNGEYIPGAPEESVTLYLGPFSCGDALFEDLLSVNPFLHAWPAYRSWASGGLLAETVARKFRAGSEASSVHKSMWVTKHSKSVLVYHHRMDMSFVNQMQWAEGCAHSSKSLDRGVLAHHKELSFPSFDRTKPHQDMARFQQFVTIYYQPSQLLSGGTQVVKRYNASMRSEFPDDMPVDVVGALMYWRNQGHDLLYHDMEQKEIATRGLPILEHTELTVNLMHPWNLYAEAIVKLGVVQHPRVLSVIEKTIDHGSPAVRWAAAKAAALIGRQVYPAHALLERDPQPLLGPEGDAYLDSGDADGQHDGDGDDGNPAQLPFPFVPYPGKLRRRKKKKKAPKVEGAIEGA